MADISKINLPNGNEYDIKDSTARNELETKITEPAGGTTGQVLKKTSTGVEWGDVQGALPTGGSEGNVLAMGASAPEWKALDADDISAAPTNHAVNASTYGLGTTDNYGHVKTVNNLTTSAHADGLALSAYQGKVLKDAVDGKADASHTHSYLPLSGGTMTGAIYKKNSNIDLKETNNGVTSNTYDAPIIVRDKNNYNIGGIRGAALTSGTTRGEIKVYNRKSDNTQVEAGFGVNIDKEGTVTYNVSTPAALKAALSLSHVADIDQGDAIKSISRSGTTFTATRLDGTTFTFTQQDNNNTYPLAIKEIGSVVSTGKTGITVHFTQYNGDDGSFSIPHDSYKVDAAGDTMTGDLSMGAHLIKSSATLNLQGTKFLNLRSPGIQCRNVADSAWAGISASTFTTQSSERYKEKIALANDDIANTVYELNVKTYDYKENVVEEHYRRNRVGLLAEELIRDIPEIVSLTTDENGNEIPEGIDYAALVPYLLKTIQVQHEDILVLYEAINELAGIVSEE